MKLLLDLLNQAYRSALKLYPCSVRRAFGHEMAEVFSLASREIASDPDQSLASFVLRELLSMPLALIRAHWSVWYQGWFSDPLSSLKPVGIHDPYLSEGSTWMTEAKSFAANKRQIWQMSLPPLILGFAIALGALIRTDVWYQLPTWQLYLSAGVPLAAGVLIAVVAIRAVAKGIPAWGLSWVGVAFMGLTLFTQVFVDELIDEGTIELSPWLQLGLTAAFLLAGFGLLVAAAKRGWRHAGLFTLAVAFTLGLSLLQSITAAPMNRDDLALLAAPAGLLMAGLLYAYIRGSDGLRFGIIALAGLVNAGAVLLANRVWQAWLGERAAASPVIPLLVIFLVLLLSGPIFGFLLKRKLWA